MVCSNQVVLLSDCLLAEAVIHKPVISMGHFVLFKSPDTTDININLTILYIFY